MPVGLGSFMIGRLDCDVMRWRAQSSSTLGPNKQAIFSWRE